MVKVMDYKKVEKEGDIFRYLVLQGGVEAVKSERTGKLYFTARTAQVLATMDDITCQSLIGSEFPGSIRKVPCETYSYTIRETNETVTLDHRYEFVSESDQILDDHVVETEKVK